MPLIRITARIIGSRNSCCVIAAALISGTFDFSACDFRVVLCHFMRVAFCNFRGVFSDFRVLDMNSCSRKYPSLLVRHCVSVTAETAVAQGLLISAVRACECVLPFNLFFLFFSSRLFRACRFAMSAKHLEKAQTIAPFLRSMTA